MGFTTKSVSAASMLSQYLCTLALSVSELGFFIFFAPRPFILLLSELKQRISSHSLTSKARDKDGTTSEVQNDELNEHCFSGVQWKLHTNWVYR